MTVEVILDGELPKGARPDLSVDGTIELERLVDVLYVGARSMASRIRKVGMYKIGPDGRRHSSCRCSWDAARRTTVEVIAGLRRATK